MPTTSTSVGNYYTGFDPSVILITPSTYADLAATRLPVWDASDGRTATTLAQLPRTSAPVRGDDVEDVEPTAAEHPDPSVAHVSFVRLLTKIEAWVYTNAWTKSYVFNLPPTTTPTAYAAPAASFSAIPTQNELTIWYNANVATADQALGDRINVTDTDFNYTRFDGANSTDVWQLGGGGAVGDTNHIGTLAEMDAGFTGQKEGDEAIITDAPLQGARFRRTATTWDYVNNDAIPRYDTQISDANRILIGGRLTGSQKFWYKLYNSTDNGEYCVDSAGSRTGPFTDGTSAVSSGSGHADTSTLPEGTNLYYTETRVTANTNVATNTAHGSLTNNPHNVTAAQLGVAGAEANVIDNIVGYDEAGTGTLAWFTTAIVSKTARLALQLFNLTNTWKKPQYGAYTVAGTEAQIDVSTGMNYTTTLTANRTFSTVNTVPANKSGQYKLEVTSGGFTLTMPSSFEGDLAFVQPSTATFLIAFNVLSDGSLRYAGVI